MNGGMDDAAEWSEACEPAADGARARVEPRENLTSEDERRPSICDPRSTGGPRVHDDSELSPAGRETQCHNAGVASTTVAERFGLRCSPWTPDECVDMCEQRAGPTSSRI